jgi:methyl-accepting chemotaxis protein
MKKNIVSIRKKGAILGFIIFGAFMALQIFVGIKLHNESQGATALIIGLLILGSNITINVLLVIFMKRITTNIEKLSSGIKTFFDYLNRKERRVSFIDIKSNDEFEVIANMINENIKKLEVDAKKDIDCVNEVAKVSHKITAGDFSQRVTKEAVNPEINQLKDDFNNFINQIQSNIKSILNVLTSYKNEKFVERIKLDSTAEFKELIDGVNSLGNQLELSKSKIDVTLTNQGKILNQTAQNLTNKVDNLTEFTSKSHNNSNIVFSEMKDIYQKVEMTVEKANEMKSYATKSTKNAKIGEALAEKTYKSMEDISSSTQAISEAISSIDAIAFQTNILSLNAAVEAATAGETGKGFAVVASEVRNLAAKSTQAAQKIKELVDLTQVKAKDGMKISNEMKDNFIVVSEELNKTSSLVESVAQEANEELESLTKVNKLIKELQDISTKNISIAKDTGSISSDVLKISNELYSVVNSDNLGGVS